MSIFGTEELNSLGRDNPARVPATLAESLESGYNTMDSSLTSRSLLYNRFEDIRTEAESAFGERFWNPGDFSHTSQLNDRSEEAFFKELNRRRESLPDPRTFPDYTSESIRKDIAEERAADRAERADISEREGTLGAIAAGIGSFGGAMADPILLSSLLIGAPWSTGVIRTAMIEAGIGLTVEVPIQAAIQVGRQQFGEPIDVGEAATNVLIAGLGAGVFAGGIKAVIAGGKRLIASGRASQEVRDAVDNLVDLEASMASNPFPDTRGGRSAHISRLEEAEVRAHGGTVRAAYLADTAVGRVQTGQLPGRVEIEAAETTKLNEIQLVKQKRDDPELDKNEKAAGTRGAIFDIIDDTGEEVGFVRVERSAIDEQGDSAIIVGDVEAIKGKNVFGPRVMRQLLDQVRDEFPEATFIGGDRITGAREAAGVGGPMLVPLPVRPKKPTITKFRPRVAADFPDETIKAGLSLSKFVTKALKELEGDGKQFVPGSKGLREVFSNKERMEILGGNVKPMDRSGEKIRSQAGAERWDSVVRAAEADEVSPSLHMTDANTGASRSWSMKSLADDIAEDEAINRELVGCVAAGVVP